MDRARRLREIWDYLPAFRIVAETQHLPSAARALRVSPSALSRAIRIVEDRLGLRLFERAGRQMRLNESGDALLGSVRTAMRQVDESLGRLAGAGLAGTVTLAVATEASWLVGPTLITLRTGAPGLVAKVVREPSDVVTALRRGDIDVAITSSAAETSDLQIERLTTVGWAVFAAPGRRRPGSIGFVGVIGEPWPPERKREVVAWALDPDLAAASCRGPLVAWLPAPLAERHGLMRVRGYASITRPILAIHRAPVTRHARTEAALAALRAAARGAPRR